MRALMIAIALTLVVAAASGEEMSKERCGPMVEGTKAIANQIKRMEVAFAKFKMKQNSEMTSDEVLKSAQRVEKARQKVLDSMKEYEAAANELTQRLHTCAGVKQDTMHAETPTDGKSLRHCPETGVSAIVTYRFTLVVLRFPQSPACLPPALTASAQIVAAGQPPRLRQLASVYRTGQSWRFLQQWQRQSA